MITRPLQSDLAALHIIGGLSVVLALAENASAQANYKLNAPLIAPPPITGDVYDQAVSPDGRRVVYLSDREVPGLFELYSVPLDRSSEAVRLSGPLPAGGVIEWFRITPDSRRVLYRARVPLHYELLSVPIDGSASAVQLDPEIDGEVMLDDVSADGRWVLLEVVGSALDLVPSDGSSPAIELFSGTLVRRVSGPRE